MKPTICGIEALDEAFGGGGCIGTKTFLLFFDGGVGSDDDVTVDVDSTEEGGDSGMDPNV